ncbi:MAG: hypothetical protein Q9M44_03525 [Ghiorsea sp.]|nr:hypothetical protein [Ghiorsea sp.]
MLKKTMFMVGLILTLGMATTASAEWGNPCNPCSMKKHNPCAMNPCDMKKHNPCAMNPCGMKKHNPCAMTGDDENISIRQDKFKNFQQAAAAGKKMWADEALGKSGLACLSCHADYELLNLGKRQNYPHYVKMVGDVVTLDQMINYCMLNPMQGEQLEPNSKEMTAMAAYFRAYRMKYLSDNK